MNNENTRNREIASYILSGSTTMVGVCITIITLFRVMKVNFVTYADEILGVNTSLFIASALLAYASLRRENDIHLKRLADVFFFAGMIIMLLVGFIIVYTTY